MAGSSTTNIPSASIPIELLGHSLEGAKKVTRRFSLSDISEVLSADGPVGASLASLTAGLETAQSDVEGLESSISALQANQTSGTLAFATVAQLNAALAYPANTGARVYADPAGANANGIYRKNGASGTGSWTRIAGDGELALLFQGPIIVETDRVFVPAFFTWNGTTFVNKTPPAGTRFFVFTRPTTGAWTVRYSVATDTLVIEASTGAGAEHLPQYLVVQGYRDTVRSDYQLVTLAPGGGTSKNMSRVTRTISGEAPRIGAFNVVSTVPDATLVALGFKERVTDPVNNNPFLGFDFTPSEKTRRAFFRILIWSSVTNNFGSPNLILRNASGGDISFTPLIKEEQIGPIYCYYSITVDIPTTAAFFLIGSLAAPASTSVMGLQYHVSDDPASWVARGDQVIEASAGDFSDAAPGLDILCGGELYVRDGRLLPIYPANLMTNRSDGDTVTTAFLSTKDGDVYAPSFTTGTFEMDPSRCGSTGEIWVRRNGSADRNLRQSRSTTIRRAPAAGTGSPKILAITDSIGNFFLQYLSEYLLARGYTPTWLGTIANTGATAEGRGGRTFADYIGMSITLSPPFAAGQEATYLAKSTNPGDAEGRIGAMPFLKVPTSGDTSSKSNMIFNGYIFDMRFYLDRFAGLVAGWGDPDVVIVHLGQNDLWYGATSALVRSQIANGLRIIYAQTRQALPNAEIIFSTNTQPRSVQGDGFWPPKGGDTTRSRPDALIRPMLKLKRDNPADVRLHVPPAWLSMSPDVGWTTTVTSTDASTGAVTSTIADAIHPAEASARQYAEVIANTIGYALEV